VHKGQLLIKATFTGSLEWPLYTELIVVQDTNKDIDNQTDHRE